MTILLMETKKNQSSVEIVEPHEIKLVIMLLDVTQFLLAEEAPDLLKREEECLFKINQTKMKIEKDCSK